MIQPRVQNLLDQVVPTPHPVLRQARHAAVAKLWLGHDAFQVGGSLLGLGRSLGDLASDVLLLNSLQIVQLVSLVVLGSAGSA